MSYLNFILVVAAISLTVLWGLALALRKRIWILDKGFVGTFVIFYFLWWAGDFLAIKFGYYSYSPEFTLNIYLGGIPPEDHLAGALVVVWIRGLFDLFERQYTSDS